MVKKWIYLMIDSQHTFIHCGFSDDILKVMQFYKSLPQISVANKNSYLVYAEEWPSKEGQVTRFKELTAMTVEQLKVVISAINPQFIEFTKEEFI